MFVHNPCDGGFELYSQSTKKKLLEDSDFDFDCLFVFKGLVARFSCL